MSATSGVPNWDRLAAAAAFAFRVHAAQRRKGSDIPYLSHLMAVSALVLEHGGDEDQAIAGLLHDAIEDVGAALEPEIVAAFGVRVARIVRDCSDTDVQPKPPWRARKLAYLAHLEQANGDALLVSACDKLHNCQSLPRALRTEGRSVFGPFNGSAAETLWLYDALAELFARRLPGPLAAELALAVNTVHGLASAEGELPA